MNRHLKGFIASVVLVVVCVVLAIASFTQGVWYGAIAPLVIAIIVLICLAIPSWRKYKDDKDEGNYDKAFLQCAIRNLASSDNEKFDNEFREFQEKCIKLIDKIILSISVKEKGRIHTNSKTKCNFVLFVYFVLRSKLCQETRNTNFIGQLDRAMEETLPNSLLSTYEIPELNCFIKNRLNTFDDIMQQSTNKVDSLSLEVEQFILKEIYNLESPQIFITQIDESLELRIEINTTLTYAIDSTNEEYNEVKKYNTLYAKPTY